MRIAGGAELAGGPPWPSPGRLPPSGTSPSDVPKLNVAGMFDLIVSARLADASATDLEASAKDLGMDSNADALEASPPERRLREELPSSHRS